MTDRAEDSPPGRPRRRRALRVGLWSCAAILALMLALAVALASLIGTRISAPGWLRERVAARIAQSVSGMSIGFGDLSIVLDSDLVPKIALQRVVIRDDTGAPLARLSDLRAAVALGPLLRGRLQPGWISLSGARVILRRAADGAVRVSIGETAQRAQEAETVAALIGRIDSVLLQPQFSALRKAVIDNLTLRFEDARAGRAWTVDGGRIELACDGVNLDVRGDFVLLGARDYATTLAVSYASRLGETAARFGIDFEDMPAEDIAVQSPALSWLGALQAPISGSVRIAVDEAGGLGPLAVRLEAGAGALRPTPGATPVAFDHAGARFRYEPDAHLIRFEALEVESRWLSARIEGQTRLAGMEDGWPDALVSQFRVGALSLNPMGVYPEPVSLEGVTLDMRLTLDPFRVRLGELSLSDRGRVLVARGDVRAGADGWHVAVDGRMPGIDPDRLLELWPESLEPKTRKWITDNVVAARLSDIEVALRSVPGHKPDLTLAFDFDDLTTRFIKKMPPIVGARGHGLIEDNRFVIVAHAGHVTAAQGGRIDIAGSSFDVPDIRIKRGPAQVRLRTSSTITAALSLIDEEPLRLLHKVGRPVTLADGMARLEGRLDFLVKDDLKPEEVAFDVRGRLANVRSETLAEGRVIAASELALSANREELEISGEGRVGRVPIRGRYRMPLGAGSKGRAHLSGRIELSERFADEFSIGLPAGSVSGAGEGAVEIDFAPDAPPSFRLHSDLAGLALRIAPLGWALAPAATGRLEVEGHLGKPPSIERLVIDANGLSAEGTVSISPDGGLQRASFARVRLDEWLDAPVDLVGRGPGNVPLVRISGGRLDLRKASLGGQGEAAGTGGGPVVLEGVRVQVTDTIAVSDVAAELDTSGSLTGRFSGRVNEQGAISGQMSSRDGRPGFIINSSDAGAVLRAAGVIDNARGGRMLLLLVPGQHADVYQGKLTVDNMRLRKAPAMAALLNAVSIVGLLEQLGGEGIHFNRVEAEFQLAPDRVTIYSAHAVGASMGISAEGYYWPERKWLDLEGLLSPVYALNMLGGFLSRRGEGLVGFKFALKGSADSPRVQVNPLSVLTPGMFRDIFRRPPPPRAEFGTAGPQGMPGDSGETRGPDNQGGPGEGR
ncbi:MAG: AsmA-like C-terminal region-containing protein [Roseovarius sp.]